MSGGTYTGKCFISNFVAVLLLVFLGYYRHAVVFGWTTIVATSTSRPSTTSSLTRNDTLQPFSSTRFTCASTTRLYTKQEQQKQNSNEEGGGDKDENKENDDENNVDSAQILDDYTWRKVKLQLEEQHTQSFLRRKPKKLPYLEARRWVQYNLGADTKEEFHDLVKNGNLRTPYIPKRPKEYYTSTGEWISWEHFLTWDPKNVSKGMSLEEEESPDGAFG